MKSAVLFAAGLLLAAAAPASAQFDNVPKATAVQGLVMPAVVTEVKPTYTAETVRSRVQGSVMLEAVVNTDGTVGEVRVVRGLHPALDESAQTALKQWRFKPATKDGTPHAVRVDVELTFTLRANGPKLGSAEVYMPGQDVQLPVVLSDVKPQYTEDAKQAGIQGTVELETVVLPDGRTGDTRVKRSLDPGLDREAMRALAAWRFRPGSKDGKAVPVQVSVEMTFSLK